MSLFSSKTLALSFGATSLIGSLFLGGWLAARVTSELWYGRASETWPSAPALVEQSEVRHVPAYRPHYSPYVVYSFVLDGKPFQGAKVDFRAIGYSQDEASAVIARFQPKREVQVRYQPGNPNLAVLIPGPHWPSLFFLAVGCFFVVMPFVVVGLIVRNSRRPSSRQMFPPAR